MEIYHWMINYTRQTEWIDRRGLILWIAFYTGGLGGGLYVVSLFFNSLWGMLIGWLIVAVLKGGAHLLYLGKPWRFWRIIMRPQTSWLARGFIFVMLFVGFGALQLMISYWAPGNAAEIVFKVLAGISALVVAVYTGFVLNTVKAVPFWNSSLLPLLFVLCGILGGFGISVLIAINGGNVTLSTAEAWSRWLLIANALLIVIYLWQAAGRETTGKESVMEQIRGSSALVFWVGIVLLGIIIPLVIAFVGMTTEMAPGILVFGVACEIVGGLALRYNVLKAGAYSPLIARPNPAGTVNTD
jgi:formate-dependent nitrite reductase membrane component NrfD